MTIRIYNPNKNGRLDEKASIVLEAGDRTEWSDISSKVQRLVSIWPDGAIELDNINRIITITCRVSQEAARECPYGGCW